MGRALLPWKPEEHGPLPLFLLLLTFITGLVDALSFLSLGRVFVANMTGNVVFLGFAIAGAPGFSIVTSLAAIGSFMVGAVVGGRLGTSLGAHRGRYVAVATYCEIGLVAIALAVSLAMSANAGVLVLIGVLAIDMGLQNAMARRLGVPDLTTTVLTLTLTGLAADSRLAGGRNTRPARRLLAAGTMLAGAAVGAFVTLNAGSSALLALVLVLQIVNGIGAYRQSSSVAAWTAQR